MSTAPERQVRLADDEAARREALDVTRSWLVAAPAGSGKTELLVQRILALYAQVDAPERVVAVTYTVKAAAEMRARVVDALERAQAAQDAGTPDGGTRGAGTPSPPEAPLSSHARRTRELAKAALANDARRGWHLLEHPSRIDIGTIDALSQRIASQLPVASALGGAPAPAEDAQPLYRRAAEQALARAEAGDVHWRALLLHYDGDASRVVELVAAMLERRDQWIAPVLALRDADLRARLERTLAEEIERELGSLHAHWAGPWGAGLLALARGAQAVLARDEARRTDARFTAMVAALDGVCAHGGLPPAQCEALSHWRGLAELLLTAKGEARRNPPPVLPPIGNGEGAGERRALRAQAGAFLDALAGTPRAVAALARVRLLPEARYSERARAFLDALVHVLPRVVAELVLVFAEEGACDFAEVTLRALRALGDAGDPTPILLAQDLRIEHFLIDEVQDTSRRQWQLVERLTSGWQEGDGRTLFVVGDPMQSIYGFREADVHNFLDAARSGRIGGMRLGSLALARNFRSQERLVEHVNATFPEVLARMADARSAAAMFTPAVAARAALPLAPSFEWSDSDEDEAARVVARVRSALADGGGGGEVAILVRARADLGGVLEALRAAGIAYDAVGLESLANSAISRDLLWLARALTQPADRLAWMSLLRAPFVGMRLADMLAVATAGDAPGVAIHDATLDARLGRDGALRRARLASVTAALAGRPELALAPRVRAAWRALGGPFAYGSDPANLDAADAMLALLAQHDRGGDIDDFDALERRAAALRAEATPAEGSRVKVMTMHAAKGLEFDTVVLPGLARPRRPQDAVLMRWRARHGDRALMVATPRARDEESPDPIDRWLAQLDADDAAAELARLVYVAMTRARERLHLVGRGRVEDDAKGGERRWRPPSSRSVLGMLWPLLLVDPREPPEPAPPPPREVRVPPPLLERLPGGFDPATVPTGERDLAAAPAGAGEDTAAGPEAPAAPPYDWAGEEARTVGVVVHRLLARLVAADLATPTELAIEAQRARVEAALATLGIAGEGLGRAAGQVLEALRRTLDDPQGRWLFDPTHTEVAAEWALTGTTGPGSLRSIAIDRSFVADGVRWIVDFKTSRHEGGDLEAFLARERERHAPQLEGYARLLRALDKRPIRLALYFPALSRRVDWPFPL